MMTFLGYEFDKLNVETKGIGLKEFQKKGYFLIDAIYEPVNDLPDVEANQKILNNYTNLKLDLNQYISKQTKIIIIKCTLYDLLHDRLIGDGYPVTNGNIRIPFLFHGQQNLFQIR